MIQEWQLVDSAFPCGGFAHSWGLEAAYQAGEVRDERALRGFLKDSLLHTGYVTMPLMSAAHGDPARLEELDALTEAFLTNAVANRASRVQGRAFMTACLRIWPTEPVQALDVRSRSSCGHQAPVTGAALRVLEVPLHSAQRMLLFLASRGVLASAVRLGIVGPYRAQRLQHEAGPEMQAVFERCRARDEQSIAQPAPLVDLMQAAHDRLYSRLFQS